MQQKRSRLVYVTYTHNPEDPDNAFSVMTRLKKKLFQQLGFEVVPYTSKGRGVLLNEIFRLRRVLKKGDILYITVVGGLLLEKLSLVKMLFPNIFLLWEVHGKPDEEFWNINSPLAKFRVWRQKTIRRMLATFVDGSISMDKSLKKYAATNLGIRNNFVLPCFFDDSYLTNLDKKNATPDAFSQKRFMIFWGSGDGRLQWHALDVIEAVAKSLYEKDRNILFVVAAPEIWFGFSFFKNIIVMNQMPHENFIHTIKEADVCLALYKQGDYFHLSPQKIVDYMSMGKPVIATKIGQITELIQDTKNGYLTNNSVNDIVQKILTLKKNKSLRKKIGRNAKATILATRSMEKTTETMNQIFQKFGINPQSKTS